MYYLRSTSAADAIQFTVDKKYSDEIIANAEAMTHATSGVYVQTQAASTNTMMQTDVMNAMAEVSCSLDNPEACEACGS